DVPHIHADIWVLGLALRGAPPPGAGKIPPRTLPRSYRSVAQGRIRLPTSDFRRSVGPLLSKSPSTDQGRVAGNRKMVNNVTMKKEGALKQIPVSDFKAHCLALLEDVVRTGLPIIVVKRGKPLVRIMPSGGVLDKFPQETLRGTVTLASDIE